MLACPHVGAVAVHHERQIAENRHAAGACARLVPLCVGKPLQVLVEQHLAGKLPARLMDGQRVAPLQRLGPRGPRPLGFARVNRTKQRVIFDPPSLLAQEAFQCPCPFAVVAPLGVDETLERRDQRRVLEAAHVGVVDPGRPAHVFEQRAIVWAQRGLAAERSKFRHGGYADKNRIDRHRADRGVGRLLSRGHLVDRQQLQDLLAGGCEPGRQRRQVADVADAPTGSGRTGEQRDE